MRAMIAVLMATTFLAACQVTPSDGPGPDQAAPTAQPATRAAPPPKVSASTARANFRAAVARMEPVAEQQCRARTQGINCDFLIRVDPDPRQPPNAFQSLDRNGRPLLTFTQALIADARNQDEIAFVIGHEAAHHIEQHIAQQRQSAAAGAIVGGLLGAALGGDARSAETISRVGATVGARQFSKEHELEADALGTIITARAGYNPLRGAAFFNRIPDPGDRFLGTHPPNQARLDVVRRTAAGL